MRRFPLTSIRGQLVLRYLAVMAVLLTALGIYQWITINDYLKSSTAYSVRRAAYGELEVLNPCYLQSQAALRRNARTVARLLGGRDTAALIVTPSGEKLASQGIAPPGSTQPLRIPHTAVLKLIKSNVTPSAPPGLRLQAACPQPSHHSRFPRQRGFGGPPRSHMLISSGNLLLVAVALGPSYRPVGYAILGRSLSAANATLQRVLLIFAVGALAALALTALVALPMINQALRPLQRVAETAVAIAAGDLEQRANLGRSPDEIGRLGAAFDTMVDRLLAAIASAEASEEQMRRFLADASHELRTPATVLRGTSQVLLRQGNVEQPEVVSALRDMHEEAVRLSRLVDDLLTLSRLDAGQELAPQPVHVSAFLQEFLERYGRVWPKRDIRIESDGLNGTAALVDPEVLRRVVTNLVDNAARYSRPEGLITISGRSEQDAVQIAVSDEGPGMTREDASHVFERFYRANKSRSRESGGTGLGLAIVCGLVDISGGRLDLDTGPEQGTTVTVVLPRAGG